MKRNVTYGIAMYIVAVMFSSLTSCSSEDPIIVPSTPSESLSSVIASVYTGWNQSSETVSERMKGYEKRGNTSKDLLVFSLPKEDAVVSYKFKDNKLMASAILCPKEWYDENNPVQSTSYKLLGEIDNNGIYTDNNNSFLISYPVKATDAYMTLGFAPIQSDLYDKVEPYGVITGDVKESGEGEAVVSAVVNGVKGEVNAGILYGPFSDLTLENTIKKKSLNTSAGEFSLTLNGLVSDVTYFYRAYAVINDRIYYGDVKEFDISYDFNYALNGRKFSIITIPDGPYGAFGITQTEVRPDDEIEINGKSIGRSLDKNHDGLITSYEFSTFVSDVRDITGLYVRMPTSVEWIYAATSEGKEDNFEYSGGDDLEELGWYKKNSDGKPHDVALKKPNSLGLYDMSGNYAECVNDEQIPALMDGLFNVSANRQIGSEALGGGWFSTADQCKVNSSIKSEKSKYAIDASKCTIRLVFSLLQ